MYLGNIVELTDAEYELIMKCPNYKYITTSGYIVKGLDSTLVSPTPTVCEDITNESTFYKCLSSCTSTTCSLTLNNNKNILIKDNSYTTNFSNLNVSIRTRDNGTGNLELSGVGIYFGSLDVSGVNINAHDSNDAAIYIRNFTPVFTGLKITGGSHNFYNNRGGIRGGGAIYSIDNIDLIDTSMLFKNNYNVYGEGGAISTSKNLTISGKKLIYTFGIIAAMDREGLFAAIH